MATRPFTDFLLDLGRGETSRELSEKLQEAVSAVEETGKLATLTFSIKIKPNKGGGTVIVEESVKTKLPERERGVNIFFVTPENNLAREDTRQPRLFETIVPLNSTATNN